MKTTIFNKKAHAFFGAAALLLAAVFTIGCKTEISSSDPEPETFTVEMKAGEHGTLTANPVIPTSGKVAKDAVITFTAVPATGYKVDKWTITGGAFETGTGTEGSTTAKVKISAETKVNVSFKTAMYTEVPFGANGADLDNYLKTAVPDTNGICYIKVTGLTAADLKGDYSTFPYNPSRLGKILNDNPTKKVALKLDEVSGLTDMSYCFYYCKSLTQAPVIPSSVTNMNNCFYDCTSLTQAPEIPSNVTDMRGCFYDCTSLTQAPEIPSNVTDMRGCFYDCTSLTQAPVIPSNVTDMSGCFYNCTSLTQAPVIPSSVTDMSACFSGCTSLTQAPVIPSSVTNMESCFSGCTSLTQAPVIPSNVTDMRGCFYNCKKITAVTLKCNYVHGNFNSAFSHCSSLGKNSIKVPAGQVQTYQDNADKMDTTADRFVAE